MFGSGKLRELEAQLSSVKNKLESAVKEKTDLLQQLKDAKDRIQDLEKQLAESEGTELKEQAKKTIVEYEGLKELYVQKNKELDESRERVEEGFAREAAAKRHDLSEEIRVSREDNQAMVSEAVQTFAGSYQYYLDQVRVLMDALSQAAQETGGALFAGENQNIKERFGARILEHLQNDTDALKQNTEDLLLIGAEEEKEAAEGLEAAEEEAAETAQEAGGAAETEAAAEEAADACEEAVETVTEAVEAAAEEAADACEEAVETAADTVEAAEEAAEEIPEEAAQLIEKAADTLSGEEA